jgi:hypothetical protein
MEREASPTHERTQRHLMNQDVSLLYRQLCGRIAGAPWVYETFLSSVLMTFFLHAGRLMRKRVKGAPGNINPQPGTRLP